MQTTVFTPEFTFIDFQEMKLTKAAEAVYQQVQKACRSVPVSKERMEAIGFSRACDEVQEIEDHIVRKFHEQIEYGIKCKKLKPSAAVDEAAAFALERVRSLSAA